MPLRQPSDALSDIPASSKRREGYEVQRAARRVNRDIPISGDPRPLGTSRAAAFALGLMPAMVVSPISVAAIVGGMLVLGTGYVQPYYLATPDATTATPDPNNTLMPCLNWYQNSGTIPAGKSVWVASWSGAIWFVGSDC